MIGPVVQKELLDARRDGRLWIALGVLIVLLVGSGFSAWQQARAQHAAQHRAQAGESERWLAQEAKNPHAAAHQGIYAFRPPGPLAWFDPGLNPYLAVTVWMEAHRQNEPLYRPVQDAGPLRRFGQLTPAVVLGALLPLLVIVLAAPSLSGERERGTLRQLLAQGVSPTRLVAGKTLALAGLLFALIAPLWVASLFWLTLAGASSDALMRVLLLGLLLGVYLGGFLLLCVCVSALCRSSRTALAVLLTFWMAGTLIAPRVVAELAEVRHPTPSTVAFRQALEADLAATAELDAELARRRAALFAAHGVTSESALPVNFNAVRLQAGEEHGYRVFDAHFGRLFTGYLAQERAFQLAGLLAPYLAWTSASSGVAGTDLRHFRHFVDSAEAYRRDLQERLNADYLLHPERDGQRYLADPALWREVPMFDYVPPPVATLAAAYAPAFAALSAWLIAALIGLGLATRRLTP